MEDAVHVGVTGPVARPELPEDLSPVLRHVESTWPQEGCGVLLRAGPQGPWRVRPVENVSPFPRSAYLFAPREWLTVLTEAEVRGEQVACVFHSHVEVPAFFSAEDRRQAAPGGEPLLPGVCYLVVGVESGQARSACLAWWQGGRLSACSLALNLQPREIIG
jgi:[CysO sulfur-carrier protein]-S-L-cysteine hydrolase